jgi:hypothetical protein
MKSKLKGGRIKFSPPVIRVHARKFTLVTSSFNYNKVSSFSFNNA